MLKEDKQLNAYAWCLFGDDRLGKAIHGDDDMEIWRIVAVGYRKGVRFGAFR